MKHNNRMFTVVFIAMLCLMTGSTAGGTSIPSEDTAKGFIEAINSGKSNRAQELLSPEAVIIQTYYDGSEYKTDKQEDLKSLIDKLIAYETNFSVDQIQSQQETTVLINGLVSDYSTGLKGIEGGIRYKAQFAIKNDTITQAGFEEYGEAAALFETNDAGVIGIHVQSENGKYVVKECFTDSPAEAAGIKAEDSIERIDGVKVSDMSHGLDEVLYRIRGAVATNVKLSISRNGHVMDFDIKRGK